MSDVPQQLPVPRYRIGDVVYHPDIEEFITATLPCPDCLGSRVWRAVSPAGEEHEVSCPRCTDQYAYSGRDRLPPLFVLSYAARARPLTVGSIRVTTHPHRPGEGVEYMCHETGVGSGSIYYEPHLFGTEAEALAAATAGAALKNAEVAATPEATRSRHFSGLTYTTAAVAALHDEVFRSWRAFRSLTYALESALPDDPKNDDEDQQAVREAIERYGKYGGTYLPVERHPIDAVIEASYADSVGATGAVAAAIEELKRVAGFADRPEAPPCTCEYIGRFSGDPRCPRHGKIVEEL